MKVGFYELEITPPLGTCLVGYFHRRPAEGVKERVYVRAVAVENDGQRFGIISVDALSITDDLFELIYSRLESFIGLPRKYVILNSTHCHTGSLFRSKSRAIVTPEEGEECKYRAKLAADCLILAFQKAQEATCRYGLGHEDKYAFVRNFKMKDGTYFTNPFPHDPNIDHPVGKLDPSVNVLVFEGADKKPFGAIVNYACHCDCVGGMKYSGDFPVIMSEELRKVYGPEFVSLYVQGAAGNINHLDVNNDVDYKVRYKEMGKSLAQEVARTVDTATPLCDTTIKAEIRDVLLKKRQVPEEMMQNAIRSIKTIPEPEKKSCDIRRPDDPVMIRMYALHLVDAYSEVNFPNPEGKESSVQVIRFGDCYFYALPGEVFSQYAFQIKDGSPSKRNFIAELSRPGYHGYIPVPELMESDNCYEGKCSSCLIAPYEGQKLVDAALDVASRL